MALDAAKPEQRSAGSCWECGLIAGLVVTAALNPWDRALYLSMVRRTPFLDRSNWSHPYRGLTQTLAGRSVSSGLYFPLEERFAEALGSSVLGGQAAGVAVGVVLNPLSLIKHQTWGQEGRSFLATAWQLYRTAGPRVFARGALPTAARDATFGCCFALRRSLGTGSDRAADFAAAALCAAMGTALSSPFNYVRNLTYSEAIAGAPQAVRPASRHLLELFSEAWSQQTLAAGLRVLQDRLRVGWGTARVAVGMALTDRIYRTCSRWGDSA